MDEFSSNRVKTSRKEDFSAEDFMKNLINEGSKTACDETSDGFNNNLNLPPFFDEALYRKGQEFFYKYLFSLFIGKLLGLLSVVIIPSTVKILAMTNMSSTEMTAYRRYLATIFHMCLWYDEDFRPGSRSWNSILSVRSLHNSASKRSNVYLKYRINQADMAFTQFGFMGIALVRGKMIGVYDASEEELKGFIHLWRTVGYVLGIEDRFNICRESVKETKEICNLLIGKVFLPHLKNPPKEYASMSKALVNALWAVNPIIDPPMMNLYLQISLEDTWDYYDKPTYQQLELFSKIKLAYIWFCVWIMRYTTGRLFFNFLKILGLWLLRNFPFLAYYQFGKVNSHVVVE